MQQRFTGSAEFAVNTCHIIDATRICIDLNCILKNIESRFECQGGEMFRKPIALLRDWYFRR
jgi:hypothetical protein